MKILFLKERDAVSHVFKSAGWRAFGKGMYSDDATFPVVETFKEAIDLCGLRIFRENNLPHVKKSYYYLSQELLNQLENFHGRNEAPKQEAT